ncbi:MULTISPECIES: hypothetical protein [Bacillus subtilis group]|uniref:hypothetical protein n=1 Tax=Bacillus subtilis group TaxID=653685 RepID=UPI001ABDCB3A|nr:MULTISPECIES: hypothetical protein [Bacillus subtilis group]MCL9628422.1 hypothetical protein [Bacillus subtilis]QTG87218.1 hypothetical protein J4048_21385 [Bacillus amyloliquefaciens]
MEKIKLSKESEKEKRIDRDKVVLGLVMLPFLMAMVLSATYGTKFAVDNMNEQHERREKVEAKKYDLLSKELGVGEKNIIIEEQKSKKYDLVLTSKGDYRVVFSNFDDPDKLKLERVLKD